MTNEELTALKRQLKGELLQELRSAPRSSIRRPWDEVREMIVSRTNKYGAHKQYQIINSISTIIRHSLGIKQIMYLTEDDLDRAKAIAETVLAAMDEAKDETSGKSA